MIITAGKTNVTIDVYFVDDDGGTAPGEPTTGKLFSDIETGGSASYHRQGAARVDFALVTQTVAGVHTDGGFIEIDATNMPGLYRLDVPDTAFATGADYVVIQLVMAAANNSIMRPLLIDLTIDLRDSVRAGLTALPAAAADGAFGLPISDAGGLDLDAKLANTNEVTAARMAALTDWIDGGRLDLLIDAILLDTGTTLDGKIDGITAAVITNAAGVDIAADIIAMKAETVLIVADTGELQTDWTDGGRLDLIIDAILLDTGTTLDGKIDGITAAVITNAAGVDIAADIIAIKAETVLIVADTGELQTDWANGGRLDLLLDATALASVCTEGRLAELDVANLPTDIARVETDTQDIQSRLPTTLISGRMDSDVEAINNDTDAAAKAAANAKENLPVTFSAGGSVTTAILDQVDGAAASSIDDIYIGRILVFNNSTLNHQVTEITDYVGATKTATITAVTTAPTATHTARML